MLVLAPVLALLAVCQGASAGLPLGWSDADVGSPGLFGSADYAAGAWTLYGSGGDICSSDQLHFAWTWMNGDGAISARVTDLRNVPLAQAGIMVRSDTTSGGIEVALLITPGDGVTFQWRNSQGAPCSYQVAPEGKGVGLPIWLRLVRFGNAFSGYWSTNGLDWGQVGSTQPLAINENPLAGLAVGATDNSTLCAATFEEVSVPPPVFGISRQLWAGLGEAAGDSLAVLTNSALNPNWPENPNTNYSGILQTFETETNTGMTNYGQRLRALLVLPVTGAYTFWIASDDHSELRLGGGERPESAKQVAWVSSWTDPRQWTKEPNQQSAPINLQAGRRYYVEALMQQSSGGDNLAVRWQMPDGTFEEPMKALSPLGTRLVPFHDGEDVPGIYLQPTNITASDGLEAAFQLLVTNQSPVWYQWLVNGTNAPGGSSTGPVYLIARAAPSINNNQVYSCIVSNSHGSVTSAPALLTVLQDVTSPTLTRALYLDSIHIQLLFSEPIDTADAINLTNYSFTNSLPVFGAALEADNQTVTLTTAPLVVGSNYVIQVNGIRDRATTPNVIAANSSIALLASPYSYQDIGAPILAGAVVGASGGYDVAGAGSDIGGFADQFHFVYVAREGDFDTRARLQGLTQTDPFAKAGLMAREGLTPGGVLPGYSSLRV